MSKPRALEIHWKLVSIPSISHQEGAIADWVEGFLLNLGVEVQRTDNNVIARTGSGPRLLLNSHLDTVPPNSGWTRDPWKVESIDGKVYGLGSNDAKASAAAMLAAFLTIHERGGPCETTLMLVQEEETGGKGTEVVWPSLRDSGWVPEGVVVGEPTGLDVGVAQKGLMILELLSNGTACHAANATAMGAVNPIWGLAEDILKLKSIECGKPHPELGATTIQPTMLSAAEAHNQVASTAKCVIDVRTSPGIGHAELVKRIRGVITGALVERSTRLEPYSCSPDEGIVLAALEAKSGTKAFGSRTMSDQVFFRGTPAIKCGPGLSERSHTANEYVLESEILEAAEFYLGLAEAFSRRFG